MVLEGHLIASTQAAIKTAIEDLEAAYRLRPGGVNGGLEGHQLNAGLYHDSEVQSAHYLDADSSLNGVRVLALSFQNQDGAEYATGRHYSLVLQADYLNLEDQIYQFSETVQFIGNCERRWELVPTYTGPCEVHTIYEVTPQQIIQSGTAVATTGWTWPSAELLSAEWKHGDQSYWSYESPEIWGENQPMLYRTNWRYVFSSPTKWNFYPHEQH